MITLLFIFLWFFKDPANLQAKQVKNSDFITSKTNHTLLKIVYEEIMESETYQSKRYTLFGHHYIGYGHLILKTDTFPNSISQEVAYNLMRLDFYKNLKIIQSWKYNLTYSQELALAHYAFCIGIGKLKRRLNSSGYLKFIDYSYINGKIHPLSLKRRQFEEMLYNYTTNKP